MNDPLELSTRRLSEARRRGNVDDVAEGLAFYANELIKNGQLESARVALDEAAQIHHARGRIYDEARCMQLSATVCRLEGRLDEAKQRADRALELSEASGPIAVSAHAEFGEIAMAEGRSAAAITAYGAALESGETTGLVGPARAALLRKRAAALVAAGQHQDAVHDLESAFDLLMQTGDRLTATRTLIEEATALQHAGLYAEAERIVPRATELAVQTNDHGALADIQLLLATQALERRDAVGAMAAAREARTQALAANAPTSYIAATVTVAQLSDMAVDRPTAYETLVVGWVTLADLLGSEMARMAFEPKLKELRQRWGAPAFDEIKKRYEEHRRSMKRG